MFAKSLLKLGQQTQLSKVATRGYKGVLFEFGPPKNQLSSTELWTFGTVMFIGVFGPSVWVLAHMQDYNGSKAAAKQQ